MTNQPRIKLVGLTIVVMIAFAANSVLNRAGIALGGLDAVVFGAVRLAAGALTLLALCALQGRVVTWVDPGRRTGVLSLIVYIFGFSLAYVQLDAGLGALLLFGAVQVTMFAAAVLTKEQIPPLRWLGAGLAFGGLTWLMWPRESFDLSPLHGALMLAAGVGWGVYSLAGRKAGDPLAATAANFALATPIALLAMVAVLQRDLPEITTLGLLLAMFSGAATSGLGYALWYSVLAHLQSSTAAVAQLTVPVIAMLGGMLFLAEPLTWQFAVASLVVLGGVAISLRAK